MRLVSWGFRGCFAVFPGFECAARCRACVETIQRGAIGRAEVGRSFEHSLAHVDNGAQVQRLYSACL